MKFLELDCGLFPDNTTVRSAVQILEGGDHDVSRMGIAQIAADDDASWDEVVKAIMTANKIVTL